MEQLTISIPESNSAGIKRFLKSMGALIDGPKKLDVDAYWQKIEGIGSWSEEDIRVFEENRKKFDQFKQQQW
jgi:hypothetical protein